MMLKKYNLNYLFASAAFFAVAGSVLELLKVSAGKYAFSLGALIIIALQLMQALEKSDDLRKHRIKRMSFTSSLLLGLASYFMFVGSNAWVVAVLIYALTTLFLSFRSE